VTAKMFSLQTNLSLVNSHSRVGVNTSHPAPTAFQVTG